ncbi:MULTISPECIES: membrane protein insertase YidC [unclassified Lentimicrobium]|uniref:membrane protein insertase YidC n=1 Tax=unclassified Lentimicrobium TaxID=2677434 RepID=UPI0015582233|nr:MULTISPECIES: membrane protein insertase YidC [unclassified Lentimicrobium]NPD44712.1 membrane protein insertase YidC [Lentimicrobium sp. S6]NPD83432.1 membrane protein insertase YidC [Lentimicrobium sp. L6]
MDRNSIIGLVLIFAIFFGFSWWNAPSEEEKLAYQNRMDSIALVKTELRYQDSINRVQYNQENQINPTQLEDTQVIDNGVVQEQLQQKFGAFANSSVGENQIINVENEVMKLDFQSLGGRVRQAELINYQTNDSLPLVLFKGDTATFGFVFSAANRLIHTQDHNFQAFIDGRPYQGQKVEVSGDDSVTISMRLFPDANQGYNQHQYIEYAYTIYGNKYMYSFNVRMKNMETLVDSRSGYIDFNWSANVRNQEKIVDRFNGSAIYYKYFQDDVDWLSDNEEEAEKLASKVKWVSFKQRFFSLSIIADKAFMNGEINQYYMPSNDPKYEMTMSTVLGIPVSNTRDMDFGMQIYMGPNEFKRLKSFDLELEKQIPIGWSFFLLAWINEYIVINVFDWLGHWGWNYGIVILVLTLLLKLVLFPIAYKTYTSSAKMRVLKPEIDEINEKFKDKDAVKKQQATMDLYKKAGVNPLAGCVPMLLQMPILFAIFRFFPSSIELRQKSFLWAHDLSSYDSILDLPFEIPFYGDHVSLFTLLMTISTLIYTKVNNDMMGTGSNQMPGMKTMMYMMPIMFLGMFNSYASGLSYYYFLANMFTFLQMYLIRMTINEDKIHAQLQANKKKPVKKSKFQQKMEDMAKQRGLDPKQMKKK